jgi:hypothetical protein
VIKQENCGTTESLSESAIEFFRRVGCERPDTVLLWLLQDRGNGKKPVPSPPGSLSSLGRPGYCAQYCVFPTYDFFPHLEINIGPNTSHENQGTSQLAAKPGSQ